MSAKTEDWIDRTALLERLRRRLPLVILCGAVAAGAAFGLSLLQTKQYEASSSLLFRDPGFDQQLLGGSVFEVVSPEREAATNVELVSLDAVADQTAENLTDISGDTVAAKIQVAAQGQSDLVSVTATDPDPEFAAQLANLFALEYIEFRQQADRSKIGVALALVERDLDNLDDSEESQPEAESLQTRISELKSLRALQTGNAELVQSATPPLSPASPQPIRNAMLGGFLGVLLGTGLAVFLERIDRRLRTPEELEEAFELPLLTEVPNSSVLARAQSNGDQPSRNETEPFRMLRTRLRYFNVDRNISSLLITSAAPGDGKSTVAWHLGLSAAMAGSRTVLVEVDFHEPTLARNRTLAPRPGLSEFLSEQVSLANAMQRVWSSDKETPGDAEPVLDVIVAGESPPNPDALLDSAQMETLLKTLSKSYDLVVIDTPPISRLADAIPLVALVDGVVIVGQLDKTRRDEASHLHDQLQSLDAPTLGVVANRVRRRSGYGYYGYGEAGASEFSNGRGRISSLLRRS